MINAYDLSLMRSSPQMSDIYLVIQQPIYRTPGLYGVWAGWLWSCRIAAVSNADPQASLTVNLGEAGPVTLLDGMTVFVGSSCGEHDRVIVGLRGDQIVGGATATLNIAASSDIRGRVFVGDYVVVLDEFRLRQRYGRFDPVAGAAIWYKDYNILWDATGVNDAARRLASMPPVPIVQPNVVKFVDPGQSVSVYFDFSDSYATAPGQVVSSWSSVGETDHVGGTWVDNVATPGNKTYSSISGLTGFRVTLEVDDGNGNAVTLPFRRGVRYVFTLRRPGRIQPGDPWNAEPITKFSINTMPNGSFSTGYWKTSITLYSDAADKYTVIPGALIILFTEDRYRADAPYEAGREDVIGSVGPIRDRENILMVGRITNGSVDYNINTHTVTFEVESLGEEASNRDNYPVVIDYDANADDWIHTPQLTVDRALHHYLAWHTTLPLVTDVYYTGNGYYIRASDFSDGTIYNVADTFIRDRLFARMLFDRYGRCICDIDTQMQPFGTVETMWQLEDADWFEAIRVQFLEKPTCSAVDGGGVYYNGVTAIPYLSRAPGQYSKYHGTKQASQNLAVNSQATLNILTGRYLEYMNREFDVGIDLSGNWRYCDIVPQRAVYIPSIPVRDGISGRMIIRDVADSYVLGGFILTSVAGEIETTDGVAGVTVDIESTLPTPTAIDPPRTDVPPDIPPLPPTALYLGVIFGTNPEGLFYNDDYTFGDVIWTDMQNAQLITAGSKNIHDIRAVQWSNGQESIFMSSYCGIYEYRYLPAGDGQWYARATTADVGNAAGGVPGTLSIDEMVFDECDPNYSWCAWHAELGGFGGRYILGAARTTDGWLTVAASVIVQTNPTNMGPVYGFCSIDLVRDGTRSILYMAAGRSADGPFGCGPFKRIYKSIDGGASWTLENDDLGTEPWDKYYSACIRVLKSDPSTVYCAFWCVNSSSTMNRIWKTTDASASWNIVYSGSLTPRKLSLSGDTDEACCACAEGLYEYDGALWNLVGGAWGVGGAYAMRVLSRNATTHRVSAAVLGGADAVPNGKIILVTPGGNTDVTGNWNVVANSDWIYACALPYYGEY